MASSSAPLQPEGQAPPATLRSYKGEGAGEATVFLEGGSYGAVGSAGSGDKQKKPTFSGDSKGNSAPLTAGLIIADVLGPGVLSIAAAVSKFGWAIGTLVIIAMMAITVHSSILMWRVRTSFPQTRTYVQLMQAAFSNAPQAQRSSMTAAIGSMQYIFLFSMMTWYILVIGKSLGMLFYNVHLCLPTWALLGCVLVLPFLLTTRRLGEWKWLIYLNNATIIAIICIPLGYMMFSGVSATRSPESSVRAIAVFDVGDILSGFSIVAYACCSQFMIVEIMAEMEDADEFPKAYVTMAAPFQLAAFLAAGLLGYFYMGDAMHGWLLDNIPFGITFQAAALLLIIHMIITYLIKSVVLCRAIHFAWDEASIDNHSGKALSVWGMIVSVVVSLCWISSQFVPFLTEFIDLLGATMVGPSCYICPIIMYVRWRQDFGDRTAQVSNLEWGVLTLEFVLMVVITIVGTYFAVQAIIEKWDVFGPPFACHCENIWKTCECSANHTGMGELCSNTQITA